MMLCTSSIPIATGILYSKSVTDFQYMYKCNPIYTSNTSAAFPLPTFVPMRVAQFCYLFYTSAKVNRKCLHCFV